MGRAHFEILSLFLQIPQMPLHRLDSAVERAQIGDCFFERTLPHCFCLRQLRATFRDLQHEFGILHPYERLSGDDLAPRRREQFREASIHRGHDLASLLRLEYAGGAEIVRRRHKKQTANDQNYRRSRCQDRALPIAGQLRRKCHLTQELSDR
jgi:hypothetical protein